MDYKPGLIAASIFDGKKKSSNASLFDLFNKKADPPVKAKKTEKTAKKKKQSKGDSTETVGGALKEIANTPTQKDKKSGVKRKHHDSTSTPQTDTTKSKKAKKDAAQNRDKFPFVHESLLKTSTKQKEKNGKKKLNPDDDDDDPTDKHPKRRKRDKTADSRTIFVGNCPLSADQKVMRSLFKDYGSIESMRFRCGPTARLELPKRAVMIKREFHEKASSYVCFVVFKDEKSASKALEKNGHVVDGHHLRVDLASNQNQHDKRKSVFVGNLPFTVTEDDLRAHFEDCGDILNIRVVRDRQTSIGKGIAYVQFDSKDGVILAQKLHDSEFQERKLRVQRCVNKIKLKVEDGTKAGKNGPMAAKYNKAKSKTPNFQGKAKEYYSRSEPKEKRKRTNFAPTNKTTSKMSFRDLLDGKIEKRVNNIKKKKKQRSQKKSDGLSAIFGDIPADMKKLKMDNPKFKGKKPKDKKKEKKKEKKKLKKAAK